MAKSGKKRAITFRKFSLPLQNRFFQVVNFGKISNQITDLQMTKIKKYTFDAEDSVADMVNDCQPPMFIMLSYVKKEDVKLREIH